jgi:hypothetical protein
MQMKMNGVRILLSAAVLLSSSWAHGQQSARSPVQPPAAAQRQAAMNPVLPPAIANNSAYPARSDWGCEVLMCLSNPNGATAVNECRPPIERLWRHLARGHGFPTCTLSNGQDSRTAGTWVQRNANYYNLCPAGTTPLAPGSYALANQGEGAQPVVYEGIGDGSGIHPNDDSRWGSSVLPPLVCVGARTGITAHWVQSAGSRGELMRVDVGVYNTMAVQPANASGNVFDIYINNQVYHRARF